MEWLFLTGGSGFIRINVMECFLETGIQVYSYGCRNVTDRIETYFGQLGGSYHFIQDGTLDGERLRLSPGESGADTVIRMAVIAMMEDRKKNDTRYIFDVSCKGTLNTLDASVATSIGRLLYVSSTAAHGTTAYKAGVLTEKMENLNPRNLYQTFKFTPGRLALRYQYPHRVDITRAGLGDVFRP